MAQTVIEKIVQAHAVGIDEGQEVHAGDYVTLVPDHVMTQGYCHKIATHQIMDII